MSGPESYSRAERLLHRLAFASVPAQIALADIEEGLFGSSAGITIERPLFVAGLPRAGTTLLLQILAELPDFTSHTYRHMPFLLCPFTWNRLSGSFRKEAALAERAHGDGVAVGFDSPEAFEEVVWKAYWPEKYGKASIGLWGPEDRNADFEAFYFQHIRKVLALSAAEGRAAPRYLCKNNANIARLSLLPELFPDCRIIVPVRSPLDHARSLRRQHVQFSALHAEDAFARRYMEWLGHYEFGAALKPIDSAAGWRRKVRGLIHQGSISGLPIGPRRMTRFSARLRRMCSSLIMTGFAGTLHRVLRVLRGYAGLKKRASMLPPPASARRRLMRQKKITIRRDSTAPKRFTGPSGRFLPPLLPFLKAGPAFDEDASNQ